MGVLNCKLTKVINDMADREVIVCVECAGVLCDVMNSYLVLNSFVFSFLIFLERVL